MAGMLDNFWERPEEQKRASRFSPQIQELLNQQVQQGLQNFQNSGSNFDAIRQKALSNWETESVPTIANRFLQGNTRNSSGFQNALSSGKADLESNLGIAENDFRQQQFGNLLQLLQMSQGEPYLHQSEGGPGQILLKALGESFGPGEGDLGLEDILSTLAGAAGTAFGGPSGGLAASGGTKGIFRLINYLRGNKNEGGQQQTEMPSVAQNEIDRISQYLNKGSYPNSNNPATSLFSNSLTGQLNKYGQNNQFNNNTMNNLKNLVNTGYNPIGVGRGF